MYNRIDASLSQEDMDAIKTAAADILNRISHFQAQDNGKAAGKGWLHSNRAMVMAERCIDFAKANTGCLGPLVNLEYMERDLHLLKDLKHILSQLSNMVAQIESTYTVLQKEVSVQTLLLYKQMQLAASVAACPAVVIEELQPFLPRTGKKLRAKTTEEN